MSLQRCLPADVIYFNFDNRINHRWKKNVCRYTFLMKSDVWGICCENKRKCNKTDETNTGSRYNPEVNESEWTLWENPRRGKNSFREISTRRRILNFHEILSFSGSLFIFWEFDVDENRVENRKTFDEKVFPSSTPARSENIFSPKLKIIYAKIDLAPSRWESIKEEFAQWWFSFVGAIWIFPFIKALIVFLKLERAAVVSERFNEIYLFHCRCLSGQ